MCAERKFSRDIPRRGLEGGNGRGTTAEPSSYSGRPCYVICHVVGFVSLSLSAVVQEPETPDLSLPRLAGLHRTKILTRAGPRCGKILRRGRVPDWKEIIARTCDDAVINSKFVRSPYAENYKAGHADRGDLDWLMMDKRLISARWIAITANNAWARKGKCCWLSKWNNKIVVEHERFADRKLKDKRSWRLT